MLSYTARHTILQITILISCDSSVWWNNTRNAFPNWVPRIPLEERLHILAPMAPVRWPVTGGGREPVLLSRIALPGRDAARLDHDPMPLLRPAGPLAFASQRVYQKWHIINTCPPPHRLQASLSAVRPLLSPWESPAVMGLPRRRRKKREEGDAVASVQHRSAAMSHESPLGPPLD